jgi:phage tail sheath protein FI
MPRGWAVTCDSTTTSAAQAQAGIVNAQVEVALVSPAEFITINLSQMQGGGSATVSA